MPRPSPDTPDHPLHHDVELELLARPEQVGAVRRRLQALAAEAGLGDVRCRDVALVVSEACANVVVHAYAASSLPEGERVLLVRAWARPGRLQVEVADHGTGMAPRVDSPGLGLGMPLIGSLTDALDIEAGDHGTTMHLTFGSDGGAVPARHLRGVS